VTPRGDDDNQVEMAWASKMSVNGRFSLAS